MQASGDSTGIVKFTIDNETSKILGTKYSNLEKINLSVKANYFNEGVFHTPHSRTTEDIVDGGIPWPSVSLPVLVRGDYNVENIRYGQVTRDSEYGGDDWSLAFVPDIVLGLILNHKGKELTFNDIANMNSGYFPPHSGHRGKGVDFHVSGIIRFDLKEIIKSELIADKVLEVLKDKKYGSQIEKGYLTYYIGLSHISGEDIHTNQDSTVFSNDDNTKFWNRFRHQCLPDGRLARHVLVSDLKIENDKEADGTTPIIKAPHKDHFHLDFKTDSTSPKPIGDMDISIKLLPNGRFEFTKPIFTGKKEDYEVYVEKEFSTDYKEYITVTAIQGFVPDPAFPVQGSPSIILPEGQYKFKFIKIKRESAVAYCSQKLESVNPSAQATESAEFFWVNIKKDGVCNGGPLRPKQTQLPPELVSDVPGEEITPDLLVGLISDNATFSTDSLIAIGAHVCAGSSVSEKSILSGDIGGHVEIANSNISGGAEVYGYSNVADSDIGYVEVDSFVNHNSVEFINNSTPTITIKNTTITDATNASFGYNVASPMFIFGKVKIEGTAEKRVRIQRTVASFDILAGIGDRSHVITGPYISNLDSSKNIEITNGATIKDSTVLVPHPTDAEFIIPGVPYSGINISGEAMLTKSTVYISGSVTGNSVLDNGHLHYSSVSDSVVKTSYIRESTVSDGSDVYLFYLEGSSLSNARVNGQHPEVPIKTDDGRFNLHPAVGFNKSNDSCSYRFDEEYDSYLMKCDSDVATMP